MIKKASKFIFLGLSYFALANYYSSTANAATITGVDYVDQGKGGQLQIKSDVPVTFETSSLSEANQFVIDIKGATIDAKTARKLDTSSFDSATTLISPYQVEGADNEVRIVVQLRNSAGVSALDVTQSDQGLTVNGPGSDGTSGSSTTQVADAGRPAPETLPPPFASVEISSDSIKGNNDQKIDAFLEASKNKRFQGRAITIKIKDGNIADVFRLISEASGFNIVLAEDVRGNLTLSLDQVPWDQALDVILNTMSLGAERSNSVLRVMSLSRLTSEKQAQLQAKLAAEASAPRITRVFPISFAKPDELVNILNKFRSAGGTQRGGPDVTSVAQVDSRTNSIIIQDIPEKVEQMRKIIQLLDTQTPQILIEAKIIEATEDFSRSFQGRLGLAAGNNRANASFNNGQIVGPGQTLALPGSDTGGSVAFAPRFHILDNGFSGINATLQLLERESVQKTIASPKLIVLNKQSANITSTTATVLPQRTVQSSSGSVTETPTKDAVISLRVTPTVTNEGSILMDVSVTRDVPVPNTGVNSRSMQTNVLIDNGSTLVIGGVYTSSDGRSEFGLPFLRNIPILGWLFGGKSRTTDRNELLVFITPRVLNEKESGLGSGT